MSANQFFEWCLAIVMGGGMVAVVFGLLIYAAARLYVDVREMLRGED